MLQRAAPGRCRIGRVQFPHECLAILVAQRHVVAPEIQSESDKPNLTSFVLETMDNGDARIARLRMAFVFDATRFPADDGILARLESQFFIRYLYLMKKIILTLDSTKSPIHETQST